MRYIYFLFFNLIGITLYAQETVGLLFSDTNASQSDGYTIFNPLSDNRVFLVDNCGQLVNQWDFSGTQSTNSYLLENGNLLQSSRFMTEVRDWNNNIVWSIDNEVVLGTELHHDIEPLPNGNFLALVRDRYTKEEMHALGKDLAFQDDNLVLEKIIEIEPVGTNSANIVWEWKFIDHIVQNFDSTKPNFGVVANNPRKLDINYDNPTDPVNFIHLNGIDYNESLDQIIISSRHLREIFIIDHSTNTAQASSSSGGNSGLGGDFLWRWGNPEVYDRGTPSDQKLGLQHDPKWIEHGVHQGKISVFSNFGYGSVQDSSSIHVIDPYVNNNFQINSGEFLPLDYDWSWDGSIMGEPMFSTIRSSVFIMDNGNALINESVPGRLSEVTPNGNVIWVYEIPVGGGFIFDQFTTPDGNATFKTHRYAVDYVGFDNVSISTSAILEDTNNNSQSCINNLNTQDFDTPKLSYYPNPVRDFLTIETNAPINKVYIFDVGGKLIREFSNTNKIDLSDLSNNLYFAKVFYGGNHQVIKIIKNN
jgi:hypothetical protein